MKALTLLLLLLLSACSVQTIDMTPEPTQQQFDLSDGDGDGMIQARDECSDSNPGIKVDNKGCGSSRLHTMRHRLDVNFANDSSVVEPKYMSEIKKLADFMIEFPTAKVIIEGHTSIQGPAQYNKKLSKKRAIAIKDILTSYYHIANKRIDTLGLGFDRLLLEGNDEYIHQKNRRIVAEISSDVSLDFMKWTIYSVDNYDD
jgi:outer membrane protein OmpA-like peptidoglycan-associated protein